MQDPGVVQMLVERGIPRDVCPGSILALHAVASADEHPLAAMLASAPWSGRDQPHQDAPANMDSPPSGLANSWPSGSGSGLKGVGAGEFGVGSHIENHLVPAEGR